VRLDLRTETTAGELLDRFAGATAGVAAGDPAADPPPIKYLLVADDRRPLCLDLETEPGAGVPGP
jgi:hypothetical protein